MFGIDLPVPIGTLRMVRPNLNIYYPVVMGLADPAVMQRINNEIVRLVNKLISDQGYYQNPRMDMAGSYEIKINEKGILSLTILNDAYAGGVHGITVIKPLTFDIRTGTLYSLKDLFKPGVDYVTVLSNIVRRQIRERNIYLLGEFKGIRPDQDFYISDKALVIFFQLYELTSYASGFPYFPISVYEIKDIINEAGPLTKLLY